MPANSARRRSSFGHRPLSSIVIEFAAGLVVVLLVSFLLHGIGHQITDWASFIVGALLILHALVSLLAKAVRWLGGITAIMMLLVVCLVALLASPALGADPETQGCVSHGCYVVYPVANGCRTIIASNTGTYPQFVISAHPLHISFSGTDYVWPVSVSWCWEYVINATNNQVIQKFLYGVRIDKDYAWEHVDGSVVKDYAFSGATPVYNADKSCVTLRVHAWVKVQIPPLPHVILPVSFVTKPWIQFNNLCVGGSYDLPTFDHEPA